MTETNQIQTEAEGKNYKLVAKHVDQWLGLHKGETFDLDLICRQLEIRERSNRHDVAKKLAYEIKKGILEKTNRIYNYIDTSVRLIPWVDADENSTIPIVWPYGHDEADQSTFGFDGAVKISPKDVIVVAGVSNTGKTALAMNVLVDNMDLMPCTLMGNEYAPAKFKARLSKMTWVNPLKEDGTPKFELIERHDRWKDIIRPDNLNIIDWINLSGSSGHEFYGIGSIIEGIQSKLNQGVAVICLQKQGDHELGIGGGFTEHLSSLYLSIDFNHDKSLRLTVRKAKVWEGRNPNGEMYGFSLVESGTQFHNIHKIVKCPDCHSSGYKSKGGVCENCGGSGYTDINTSGIPNLMAKRFPKTYSSPE